MPTVSFIVPARDAAATLADALHSLQAQTRPDWEAIVVDDGSRDATAALAARFAAEDPRIRCLRRSPSGVSAARNAGLARATAPWVCFLDADDWLAPSFLEAMLAAAGEATDLVYCATERLAPTGELIARQFEPEFKSRPFEMLAAYCPVCIHSVLVRRALAISAGGFDAELATCEDWDLWQRLARRGLQVESVPAALAKYRASPGTLSRNHRQMLADALRVLRRGHAPDPRVRAPHPDFAAGADPAAQTQRESKIALWYAASEVGVGGDGARLLEVLGRPVDLEEDAEGSAATIAHAIAFAAGLPSERLGRRAWEVEVELRRLLERLAAGSARPEAYGRLSLALEPWMLSDLPDRPSDAVDLRPTANGVIRRLLAALAGGRRGAVPGEPGLGAPLAGRALRAWSR